MLKRVGFVLVLLMVLLQFFYAIFAYFDPVSFSNIRGTKLFSIEDLDWVKIYASRTIFIALIVAILLYNKNYKLLAMAALFGAVMPITDGWLAYHAGAPFNILVKHIVTVVYLVATAIVMQTIAKRENS